jgi:hypothetical protein
MAVRLLALSPGSNLLPGISLVLLSVRESVDPRAKMWLEILCKLKYNYFIVDRTGDLQACSTVSQPSVLQGLFSRDRFQYVGAAKGT